MEKYKARMKSKMFECLGLTQNLFRFREMINDRHYATGCACDFEHKMPTTVALYVLYNLINLALESFEEDGVRSNREWVDMFITDYNGFYHVIHYYFGVHFDMEECRNCFVGVNAG